jgi:hypothetical protein
LQTKRVFFKTNEQFASIFQFRGKIVGRSSVAIQKDLLETIASYSTRASTRPVMTEGGFS